MAIRRPIYHVVIAGVERDLRLFEVKPGLKIAILNILGDTELVEASAKALAKKLAGEKFDALVTAESKSIPLAHSLSVATRKPYVILRKNYKPYMGKTVETETLSITTGKPQMLYLDEKDQSLLKGKKVVIIDDVISTGSTLEGMSKLMKKAGAKVVKVAAIFTEGDCEQWKEIIALGNLPLFTD
jgi:adenine phosphoribosyltransferase